eukprot:13408222-Alexandrium_andersonii.AAC.1
MDDQAAGHIHLCSETPFVGPVGSAPEAPSLGQPRDGQLEEGLEAIIEEMNGGTQRPASEETSDREDQQRAHPPPPGDPGHNQEAE